MSFLIPEDQGMYAKADVNSSPKAPRSGSQSSLSTQAISKTHPASIKAEVPDSQISSSRWEEFVKEHSEVREDLRNKRGLDHTRLAERASAAPALLLKKLPKVESIAVGNRNRLDPQKHAKFEDLLQKVEAAKSRHDAYRLTHKALKFLERELSNSPIQQAQCILELKSTISYGPQRLLLDPVARLRDNQDYQMGTLREKFQMQFSKMRGKFWDIRLGYQDKLNCLIQDLAVEAQILRRQEAFILPIDALETSLQTLAESLGAREVTAVFTPFRERVDYTKNELRDSKLHEVLNALKLLSSTEDHSERDASSPPMANPGCILELSINKTKNLHYAVEIIEDKETSEPKIALRAYLQRDCQVAPKGNRYKEKMAQLKLFSEPRF